MKKQKNKELPLPHLLESLMGSLYENIRNHPDQSISEAMARFQVATGIHTELLLRIESKSVLNKIDLATLAGQLIARRMVLVDDSFIYHKPVFYQC